MSGHLSSEFDALLVRLDDALLRMGGLGMESLAQAAKGLFERDAAACNAVIAADDEIDDLEKEVQRMSIEIIARYVPVATDLRVATSALRLATELERVGDECVSIARRARQLNACPERSETKLLEPLFDMARMLFSDALGAMAKRQAESAAAIAPRDVDLDVMCKDITGKLTSAVQHSALGGSEFANLAIIARSLEHIGDQSKGVAAETLFRIDPNSTHHTY